MGEQIENRPVLKLFDWEERTYLTVGSFKGGNSFQMPEESSRLHKSKGSPLTDAAKGDVKDRGPRREAGFTLIR
jgi:hypothetical protein